MIFYKLFALFGCFAAIVLSTTANDTTLDTPDHKQSKVHIFEGVIRYNLHKSDLDHDHLERCTETPEFELHYVTWKIRACKEHTFTLYGGDVLKVQLVAVFEDETEEWSCEAEATFKVLPKESSHNAAYMRFGYFNYDRVHSSPEKKDLVGWDNLVNRHMIEDIAAIDVTIKAKPPNRIPGIQHTSTKFQMRLLDVKTLDELSSEEASIRGMRWKAIAMKQNEYLSVFVLVNEDDMDLDYAWEVTATFQLVSLDPDKSVTRTFSGIQFDWTRTNYGFNTFLKWSYLMDPNNKFVIGNTALLEIELNVEKPNPIT